MAAYLFPGGRRAVIAAAEKEKKTRKAAKALVRTIGEIWSLNGDRNL